MDETSYAIMKIHILDYGTGNLTSVRLAFERVGAEVVTISDAEEALDAERIVFPGVGSAGSGMRGLQQRGFDKLLRKHFAANKPMLAVCLGMQMLFDKSDEDNGVAGLGLLPGRVELFDFSKSEKKVKIPHMGWNTVSFTQPHPVLEGIASEEAFYFVHSYFANPVTADITFGKTQYADFTFTSMVARGSLFATQFHPERSGEAGLKMLKNFLSWEVSPCC